MPGRTTVPARPSAARSLPLVSAGLEVLSDLNTTAASRTFSRGENVVRADDLSGTYLVAVTDVSLLLPKQQRTEPFHPLYFLPRFVGQNMKVLRRERVSHMVCLVEVINHDNIIVVPPTDSGNSSRVERLSRQASTWRITSSVRFWEGVTRTAGVPS